MATHFYLNTNWNVFQAYYREKKSTGLFTN